MARVRRSVTRFDLVLGGYAGVLALVGTGVATGRGFLTPPPLAAAAVALVAGTGVVATRENLATRIVRARVHVALAAIPLIIAFVLVGTNERSLVAESVVTRWLPDLAALTTAGVLVHITALNRHVATLREHERVLAEWRAPADSGYRWGVRGLSLLGAVAVLLGGSVVAVEFHFVSSLAPMALGPVTGVLLAQAFVAGRTRRYTLFGSGLAVRRAGTVGEQFVPTGQLRSVAQTDRTLMIRRGLPWPFPYRCALAGVENPDAIESALRGRLGA